MVRKLAIQQYNQFKTYPITRFLGYDSYEDPADLKPGFLSYDAKNFLIQGGKLLKLPGLTEWDAEDNHTFPITGLYRYVTSEKQERILYLADANMYAIEPYSISATSDIWTGTDTAASAWLSFVTLNDICVFSCGDALTLRKFTIPGNVEQLAGTSVPSCDGLVVHKNRIFGFLGSTVYYCDINDPEGTWSSINVDLNNASDIVAVAELSNMLYIFKENKTYQLDTYSDSTSGWKVTAVPDNIEGVLKGGVFNIPDFFTVVATKTGVYAFNGANFEMISEPILNDLLRSDYTSRRACFYYDDQTKLLGFNYVPDNLVKNHSFTDSNDGMYSSPGLAIGTTVQNVASDAFTYVISGIKYSKAAVAAGTVPGNDVVPQDKYGCVAFDIASDGTIDVIEAADNATGYDSKADAIEDLPDEAAGHVRMGNVTVIKDNGAFTFGTTSLADANTTVSYNSAHAYGKIFPNWIDTIVGTGVVSQQTDQNRTYCRLVTAAASDVAKVSTLPIKAVPAASAVSETETTTADFAGGTLSHTEASGNSLLLDLDVESYSNDFTGDDGPLGEDFTNKFASACTILSNECYSNNTDGGYDVLADYSSSTDCYISAKFVSGRITLILRSDGSNYKFGGNSYMVNVSTTGANLWKVVNGVANSLDVHSSAVAAGSIILFRIIDNDIYVYDDGVLIMDATDATYSSGYPAVGSSTLAVGTLDDLSFGESALSGTRVSTALDISTTDRPETTSITINDTLNGQTATYETALSLDAGASYQDYVEVENGDSIPGITVDTDLTLARLKYRTTLTTTDVTALPQLDDITFDISRDSQPFYLSFMHNRYSGTENDQCDYTIYANDTYAESGGSALTTGQFGDGASAETWYNEIVSLSIAPKSWLRVEFNNNISDIADIITVGIDDIVFMNKATGQGYVYNLIDKCWQPTDIQLSCSEHLQDGDLIGAPLNRDSSDYHVVAYIFDGLDHLGTDIDSKLVIGPTNFGYPYPMRLSHVDYLLKEIGDYDLSITYTSSTGGTATDTINLAGTETRHRFRSKVGLKGETFKIEIEDDSDNPSYELYEIVCYYTPQRMLT